MAEPIHPLKLASVLLQYPSAEAQQEIRSLERSELRGIGGKRGQLEAFVRWYADTDLGELERTYVETFDFAKQRSLHLTYHLHGDRRQRGIALLRLKQAYESAGYELVATELPDYLPLMLEFASFAADSTGRKLLDEHRVAIELVWASLGRDQSPFAVLFDLVVDGLPSLTSRQLGRLKRLAAEGPPTEQVGLEPFAPPEVMPADGGYGARPLVGGER